MQHIIKEKILDFVLVLEKRKNIRKILENDFYPAI